jgi:hypothetical protein
MFFFVIYSLAGLYLLLIAAGVLHRRWLFSIDEFRRPTVRFAIVIFGLGVFFMGVHYVWIYWNDHMLRTEVRQRGLEQKPPAP